MSDDTCACDMRHPDDESPFEHHPYCIVGQQRRKTAEPEPNYHGEPDWGTYS